MAGLIEYNLSKANADHQVRGQLYDYLIAGNGVFLRAERERIKALIPIAKCEVRGLPPVGERIIWTLPRVPSGLVYKIDRRAAIYAQESLECVWHLLWSPVYPYDNGWELHEPEQERSTTHCRPLVDGPGSTHERALIEIHSHHYMPTKFSKQDDAEEKGFRFYGVIGDFGRPRPVCRMRLGVHGYFAPMRATSLLECENIWSEV